jgi:replication factor C small subunit
MSDAGREGDAASSCGTASLPHSDLWTEKYRPGSFADLAGNSAIVRALALAADTNEFPHLILAGPSGCGKTSAVACLARAHLGAHYTCGCIEVNASDHRRLEDARGTLKNFAQQNRSLPPGKLKIIILEECDSMPAATQAALRRLMERNSATTRFVLTCNTPDQVQEGLQSRCAVYRFQPVDDLALEARLRKVLLAERCSYDDGGIKHLVRSCRGDLRVLISDAQSAVCAFGELSRTTAALVAAVPCLESLRGFWSAVRRRDWRSAFEPLQELENKGYNAVDIVLAVGSELDREEREGAARTNAAIAAAWYEALADAHIAAEVGLATGGLHLDALVCRLLRCSDQPEEN